MRRHFVLTPFGSAGDVNPFLWLGRELLGAGHEVTLIAPSPFADSARAAGISFVPVGGASEYESVLRNPKLWHPWHGMHLTLGLAGRMTADYYDAISARRTWSRLPLALVGSMLAFGARLARERFRAPLASVHLQPTMFLSLHETPVMRAHLGWFARLPLWAKRLFFALPNPLDQCAGRAVRSTGAVLGVKPPRSLLQWMHSPDAVLGLFPDWFAAPQPDWPPQTRLAGFPLYDGGGGSELTPELEEFLRTGAPPVVFTLGTAMQHGRRFFAAGVGACQQLGRRAVLVASFAEQLPADLPPSVLAVRFAPFARLLPRAAAIVHHGGIGTSAQALAVGIPQLIMPMAHDQPDNALRLVRLGVARRLYPSRFTPANVAAELGILLGDAGVPRACAAASAKTRAANPAAIALTVLEHLEFQPDGAAGAQSRPAGRPPLPG